MAIKQKLMTSQAKASGMGFRQIYNSLKNNPDEARPGSFSTLKKCLQNLEADNFVYRSPVNKKYFTEETAYAHYDRDLVMDAILQSNVLGGGRLFHPDMQITNDEIIIPEEPLEISLAVDAFIEANLTGWERWPDKGVVFIETFDGAWPEKPSKKTKDTKTHRKPSDFIGLVMRRLNAKRSAQEWIRAIWDHARRIGLVEEGLPLEKASTDDIERIWSKIFAPAKVKTIVLTEYVQPQKLLDWWKASQTQPDRKTDKTPKSPKLLQNE